jgi:hypothetical protein
LLRFQALSSLMSLNIFRLGAHSFKPLPQDLYTAILRPEKHEKFLRVSSSVKGKFLPTPPSGSEWATLQKANVGGDRINPGIKILPVPSANGLLGGQMSR